MTEALARGSMIDGMTMVRRTVTLDAKAVELATEFSDGNFSAYINEALARKVRRDALAELVAESDRRFGAITPAELADARAQLAALDDRDS